MKKLLALVLCLCLALLSACTAQPAADADASLDYVKGKGTLVVGLDASFPPMGFADDTGALTGYDLEVAQEVCRRLGVEMKTQPIDWANKDDELASKGIDCIWNGFTVTPDRQKAYSLSVSYLHNAQVVVVLQDSSVNTLADLAGGKLALQSASSASKAVNANTALVESLDSLPVEYADYAMVLTALEDKTVDAAAMDLVAAEYYINVKGVPCRILEEQLTTEEYAVAFRKGDLALAEAVNAALKDMAADGTLTEITVRWFGKDESIVAKQ